MVDIVALCVPIVLSAVFVFVASSVIHMITAWHKTDYRKLPDENKTMEALRPLNIPPGDYMMPSPGGPDTYKSKEFEEKMNKGPVAVMTVLPSGQWTMGRNLALWFVYCVVIGIFAAYVAGRALGPGTPYLRVFRFVGTAAFLGYTGALWQFSIWYRRSWVTTIKGTIDGLIYAMVTAGTFGWLWPK